MKETISTIMEWHKSVFPDATLDGQLAKWEEETNEFRDADENGNGDALAELADLAIVSAGIKRFDKERGIEFLQMVYITASECGYDMVELWDAIEKKMEINRARKWNKKDGLYKHVEE